MPPWDARGPWGVYLGTGRVGRMGEGSAPHPPRRHRWRPMRVTQKEGQGNYKQREEGFTLLFYLSLACPSNLPYLVACTKPGWTLRMT